MNRQYLNNLRKLTYRVLPFLLLAILISCSDDGTGPDSGTTVSGKATLSGQSDHSGINIMLFKPIEIDTMLSNLNSRYPGIGVEVSQRTEFYWWEHTPVYQTTTGADGSWRIENVSEASYHIVAEKDGYGWKVIYNAHQSQKDIQLAAETQLSGTIAQDMTVNTGAYVVISGRVIFAQGRRLTIEPGVNVEFVNNGELEINGRFACNGDEGNEIYFISREASNISGIRLLLSKNSSMAYACFNNVARGVIFATSDSSSITHTRIDNGRDAVTIFDSKTISVANNTITNMMQGIVSDASGDNDYTGNLIVNIAENGIDAYNEDNSLIQNNLFKYCGLYGLAINSGGSPSSIFFLNNFNIIENDFIHNQNHIFVGKKAFCIANQNNFVNETNLIVNTDILRNADTLNFQYNYWGYTDVAQIEEKIFDHHDEINPERPIIDYLNYKPSYSGW